MSRYSSSIDNLARAQTCMYNKIMLGVVVHEYKGK